MAGSHSHVRVKESDLALATRILDAAMPLEASDKPPEGDVSKAVSLMSRNFEL